MLAAFVVFPLGLWLVRIPIAEMAARQACESRELTCTLNITALSPGKVLAKDVLVEAEAAEPLKIQEIELELIWPGLLSPQISFVRAVGPDLTVDARNGKVRVNLLEGFQDPGSSSDSDISIPPFAITDGQITVLTDAGPLKGQIASSGSLDRELVSRFSLEPASLMVNDYSLNLTTAEGEFVVSDGRLSGDAIVDLETAQLEALGLEAFHLDLQIEPEAEGRYKLTWTSSAEEIRTPELESQNLTSEGVLAFSVDQEQLSLGTILIESLEGNIFASELSASGFSTSDLSVTTSLTEADSRGLHGTIAGHAGAIVDGLLDAERVVISGDITLASRGIELSDASFKGGVSAQGAAVSSQIIELIQSAMELPDPLNDHGEKFSNSLAGLFSGFSTGLEFEASFLHETADIDFVSHRPVALQSDAGGQSLSWQPIASESWIALDEHRVSFTGAMQYADPQRSLRLTSRNLNLNYDWLDDLFSISGQTIRLAETEAGGRRVSADLSQLDYRSTPNQKSVEANGAIRFTGPAFGMELKELQAQGRILASPVKGNWQASIPPDDCLTVAFGTAKLPDLSFGPANTQVCASDRPIFYSDGRALAGRLRPEKLELPFVTSFADGDIGVTSPHVDWRLDNEFRLNLTGGRFSLPFELPEAEGEGAATGRFWSGPMKAGLQTGASGLGVDFGFTDGEFKYGDLPVKTDIAQLEGDGSIGDNGINIQYSVIGARMSDALNPANDALYEPLMTSGKGQLTGQGASYDGRVRLVSRDAFVGNLNVSHKFDGNLGSANLQGGEMIFSPKGLQLHDLSERMRGLAVSASGVIRPSVEANWREGVLKADGDIAVEGMSFSTFRIGQIEGLSGTLSFEDLLGLKTYEAQTFTIDKLRFTPTIVLLDGEINLSVLGPEAFKLESAHWPFVGGEVEIKPIIWRYDNPNQMITVTAENWELARLLSLFEVPDLRVEGKVSGQFPIEIVDANAYFRNARLTAVEDGFIQYDSKITRSAGESDPYAKMAFDALKNFQYRVMSVGANGNLTGNIVIDLALSGNNPDVLDGQLFNLNISLDSDLAKLVHAGSISGSVQSAQDMVVDLVKQKNEAEQND